MSIQESVQAEMHLLGKLEYFEILNSVYTLVQLRPAHLTEYFWPQHATQPVHASYVVL